jgi:nucleotide-binding universal stress UspA family protein
MSNKPFIVVVGCDYSVHAERALIAAFEQAQRHVVAEIHVAHVTQSTSIEPSVPGMPVASSAVLPGLSLSEQREHLVDYLKSATVKLRLDAGAKARVVAHVLLDTPMVGLVSLATQLEADLIVVGTHGRNGIARWLLGSVAEGVVRQAACPVLVIPPARQALEAPSIEPPCPHCLEARKVSAGEEMWCKQHKQHHARRHTYHQSDRVGAETNLPLFMR